MTKYQFQKKILLRSIFIMLILFIILTVVFSGYVIKTQTIEWFFPHLVEIDVLKLYNTFKIYLLRGIFIWTNLLSYLTQPMN